MHFDFIFWSQKYIHNSKKENWMLDTRAGTEKCAQSGVKKASFSIGKTLVLGIMAGFFIAIAGHLSMLVSLTVGNTVTSKLIEAMIFPLGLIYVVYNGSELFTGNNLMIISVYEKKIRILDMLKNWVFVYIGNFIGSLFVSVMFVLGDVYSRFSHTYAERIISTAVNKCELSFDVAFFRGLVCNILVCFAVMLSVMINTNLGRILGLYLPIMIFVFCGLEHSVANMSYISGGIFADMAYGHMGIDVTNLTWFNFLVGNMLPVTLGNVAGGITIGSAYWYITRPEKKQVA